MRPAPASDVAPFLSAAFSVSSCPPASGRPVAVTSSARRRELRGFYLAVSLRVPSSVAVGRGPSAGHRPGSIGGPCEPWDIILQPRQHLSRGPAQSRAQGTCSESVGCGDGRETLRSCLAMQQEQLAVPWSQGLGSRSKLTLSPCLWGAPGECVTLGGILVSLPLDCPLPWTVPSPRLSHPLDCPIPWTVASPGLSPLLGCPSCLLAC